MTHVIAIQHHECETLGAISDALARSGIHFSHLMLSERSPDPDIAAWDGLIVLGGPYSVCRPDCHPRLRRELALIRQALDLGRPVLGICLGSQLVATALGGRVYRAPAPEIGWLPVRLEAAGKDDRLFQGLPHTFTTCVWHGDVFDLPAGAVSLASSQMTASQAYRYGDNVYGFLFHLEMKLDMVAACVGAFEPGLRGAGMDPDECLIQAQSHLSAIERTAATVFDRWTALVRSVT